MLMWPDVWLLDGWDCLTAVFAGRISGLNLVGWMLITLCFRLGFVKGSKTSSESEPSSSSIAKEAKVLLVGATLCCLPFPSEMAELGLRLYVIGEARSGL